MIALVASWLLAGHPVPGCRAAGPSVRCVLAAPVPVPPAPPKPVRVAAAHPRPAPVHRRRVAKPDTAVAHADKPPTTEEMGRHILSLVAIDDCTGARAYVRSVGQAGMADQVFADCLTHPAPPPQTASR